MNVGLPGDTIVAISTPLGIGGIGIVRVSGPQAQAIAGEIFRRKEGKGPFLSHRFYLGEILRPEDQMVLDEVLLVFMRQPKTYTREDVVEIQCHSGLLVLQEILQIILRKGARIAQPGEFTQRAFLNGRIDLTQAEAVIDLISSKTKYSLELANRQRTGQLAGAMGEMKKKLMELLAFLEAGLDFPEEDIPELSPPEIFRRIQDVQNRLEGLLHSYEEGKVYREGISAAIIGKPNVGKSSLLNSLLMADRAIVTDIPGTTRDVIEEMASIGGVPLRLMDTAGMRPAQDVIEEEGVRRTRECLSQADLAIWVVDGSTPLSPEDLDILLQIRGKKTVIAVNKNDLPQHFPLENLRERIPGAPAVPISALLNIGLDLLKKTIRAVILDGRGEPSSEVILTNFRHKQALEKARESLSRALGGSKANLPGEFIAMDLGEALKALGEIVGEATSDEILEKIFSQFCIGK